MRNQKSGRGMARIRNFEPSGQDGLQTFRFLISDFSRFQEFLLELGVLLGDLLRHLPPLRFQAPGQGLVLHRQDLGGQHSSIFRAVQCYRSHRDAAGHLDCGQQGIQPIQDAPLHGNADDRQGGVGGKGPRQMGSHAGGADDHAESPLPGGLGELSRLGRRPVGAEDMGLIGDVQGVQLGTGPFDHVPMGTWKISARAASAAAGRTSVRSR